MAEAEEPGDHAPGPAADPNVIVKEPEPGQKFEPGGTVSITVRVLAPLKRRVTDAYASVSGMGMLPHPRANWQEGAFRWHFAIPQEFAGPLTINAFIVAGLDPAHPDQALTVAAAPVTVAVQPRESPDSITLQAQYFHVNWPGCCGPQMEQLYVRGRYGGRERDLSSAESGTIYRSSNPAIARVDNHGSVRILGPGLATITADNRGARDTAGFLVEDQTHPLPPQDLTAQVHIARSAALLDPEAKAYRTYPMMAQTVTVQNTSDQVLVGPLYLMVSGVPVGMELWLKTPNAPANPPPNMVLYGRYQTKEGKAAAIRLRPKDGLSLKPGDQLSQQIFFLPSGSDPSVPEVSLSLVRSSMQP